MRTLCLFLCFISIRFGFSQKKESDSIKNLLEVHVERDSTRVNLLNQLTKYNTSINISKNEALLKEAISISKSLKYDAGLAYSYTNLTSFYIQSGNFDKALPLALKTKKLQESIQDSIGLIYTNGNIARLYTYFKKPEKAIALVLENLKLLKNSPESNLIASNHFYLATTYTEIKDYDNAETHYKAAKNIAEKAQFKTGVAIANSSLGIIQNKKGHFKNALNYLNQSLEFFESSHQMANVAHTNLEMGEAYAGLNRFNNAIIVTEKAVNIYTDQGNLKNLITAYQNLSDFFKKQKNFEKANEYLEKHYEIKDSIFNSEKMKVIEEMKTKYETDNIQKQKEVVEKEIVIEKLKSNKNRNLFMGSVLTIGLLLLSSALFFSRLKNKKKAELILIELKETQKRLAVEKQYRDSELKALKAQMNPHFIFNALNSIQDYIVLNQKNLASDYLSKFAILIRNYLHFSNAGFISIKEEIENLNLYLELEKLRFEEQLSYTFDVDTTLHSEVIKIPTMLIQPYVENALKHGLLHKRSNRILSIKLFKTSKNTIECHIIDNGVGRKKSEELNQKRAHQHKPFALEANTQRLDLLNYGKDNKIGVEIIDLYENNQATGTKVLLKIPILK